MRSPGKKATGGISPHKKDRNNPIRKGVTFVVTFGCGLFVWPLAAVHVPAFAYLDDKDYEFSILDVADYTVVPNPKTPQVSKRACQNLAASTWIVEHCHAFVHEIKNTLNLLTIKLP